jgi:LPXTG-motif cell wall-anchored protein
MRPRLLFVFALTLMLVLTGPVVGRAAPAATSAADLRVTLNSLLTEHTALAASATGAALGGREAQFKAAAAALDANSVDLSKAIGSVYGSAAEQAFLPLWRKHIGFFVDYTQAVAAKDQAKADKAVADLTQYTQDFGAFLNSANPNLPKDAVAGLVKTHVLTLKDVVDAQAAGDQPKVYTALRTAFAHMPMIGDPLADAIVKQFPDKFGAASGGAMPGHAMPAAMPKTGEERQVPWAALIAGVILLLAAGALLLRRARRAA